ncbi:membrane protein insertase YidC [Granulicella sp. S156]|uniref:membrane protein insertase YidC n=1 Tax=Granulicella sp. S156 TaxID=1747224 RepID=UPI00131DCD7E|nr:membrane protein insertase YidC [Granulicella sp. S156]
MPEFRNPNQGGGGSQDNRSFLVMLLVMFGVIFGLQYWRAKHTPPPSQTASVLSQQSTTPSTTAPATAGAPNAASSATSTAAAVQAAGESSTIVENELYRITFSNRGAQVTSWILKGFKDNAGHPLDLVHEVAAKQFGYPLSLYTYDENLTESLAQALYVPSATGTLQAPASLSFDYSAGNITVHKTFSFGADYVVHADAVLLRDGAPISALLSWPSGLGDMETPQAYGSEQIDTSTDGKDQHLAFKNISGGATLKQPFDFAGLSDQYFAAVFMPDHPQDAMLVTLHKQIDVNKVSRMPGFSKGTAPAPVLGAAIGSLAGHDSVRLFVGPKSIKVLKSIKTANGSTLETLLDFGFWGPVGKVLFLGLQAVHSVLPHSVEAVHNYSWGWAIVIFTIFINLLLLPLRVQGMRSMLKMQRIQPQIDAIKAKYKNPKATDPKMADMNAEIMKTQKENGVSMFGGCIPSLIQLPLLFAFFTMMTRVVELRQAHWYWLPDLSSADPYHILPILMVITSFLAQYFTPSPGVDPQQQKMMAFMMPVFSGYMTWQYASGLALYWNIGNIIMILQQQVMNRTSLGREMREIAAKRSRKAAAAKVGGARTIQGRR